MSDGWNVEQTAGVHQLGGAADIDWFQDPFDMTPMYEENLGDDPRKEDVLLAGMWQRALQLETDSDMSYALLDPGDSDQDGEWALYVYKGWSGELPDRYPSFRAYMEAMYRGFHSARVERPDFVNATTRAQDVHVEEARLLALSGRYEEALPLLEEALSFGRPRSAVLLNQRRLLLAPHSSRDYGNLVADPRCTPEILPVEAMTPARGGWRLGGDDHWLGMMSARGAARKTAEAVLSTMRRHLSLRAFRSMGPGRHRVPGVGPLGGDRRRVAGAAGRAAAVGGARALADRSDRPARRSGPGSADHPGARAGNPRDTAGRGDGNRSRTGARSRPAGPRLADGSRGQLAAARRIPLCLGRGDRPRPPARPDR